MRLNKAIALTGLCSRRQADQLILDGKVKVNGSIVYDFSFQVDPEKDCLEIDNANHKFKDLIYIILNKPPGIITSRQDEHGRKTVMDLLPKSLGFLKPVGRLDMYSQGLLLLSNDGEFTQKLTHPSMHLSKTYIVKIKGSMTKKDIKALSSGIKLEDGFTLPAKVKLINCENNESQFQIIITEGRNRQIRRMCEALGYVVVSLCRVALGRLQLGDIEEGKWRYLTQDEIKSLYSTKQELN